MPPGGFDEELYGNNFTHTAAGFGQVSFNLPDGFQLQAGGAIRRGPRRTGLNFVPEYSPFLDQSMDKSFSGHNFTGKVALNWKVDPNNFLYAFVASGAKPGGLNISLYTYPQQPIPAPFGQEYVVDYEVGWKSSLFDNHVRTQSAASTTTSATSRSPSRSRTTRISTTELNDPSGTKLYGFEASAQAVFGGLSVNRTSASSTASSARSTTQEPRASA